MKQLSSLDASLIAGEDGRIHGHICSVVILDPSGAPGGVFNAERVAEVVRQRLHLLPMFRWRLVELPLGLDYPYWLEEGDIDLEFHIREAALPAPGDDHQLADLVARLHSRPLDRGHPLWELYVIEGLSDGRVAVLTKMHHAAIDGVSGAEVMSTVLDPDRDGRQVVRPQGQPGERSPGQFELVGRGLLGLSTRPVRALRALPRVIPNMDQIAALRTIPGARHLSAAGARLGTIGQDGGVLERPRLDAPHTRFNERVTPHRRFAFTTLPLDDIKAIKRHFAVTVNDVVLALATGALRRRMIAQSELPREPLLAMVPVSVRAPGERAAYGVRVSSMIVPIPTDEPNPEVRVNRVHEAMRSAKERHRAMPATLLQDTFELLPTTLLARAARATAGLGVPNPLRPPMNLMISNVPGARIPLYCAGALVEHVYPASMVADGMALNITVISHCDNLDIGIVGDRDLVPDTWELADDLEEEFQSLMAVVTSAIDLSEH
jgi:diacylglycerol O-acyltransferase / wax synthase